MNHDIVTKANYQGDLKTKTISGVTWSFISQFAYQGLAFLISIVLTRLLPPEDFGLLGMVAVFTGFATMLNKMGIAQALIYQEDLNERHKSSAFWFSIGNGIVVSFTLILLSSWVAEFYREPRIGPIMILYAAIPIVSSFMSVHNAILRRNLDYKRIATSKLIGTFVGGFTAIWLAYQGFGVWSLVWYQLISVSSEVSVHWIIVKWRPYFTFNWDALRDILGFSTNLTAFQIINYFTLRADNLLIGKYLGPSSLGFYSRAYNLMLFPVIQVSDTIGRVVWAALARIQENKPRIRDIILRSIRLITLVTFPLTVGGFVVADELIITVFGVQWAPIVPVFRILCFVGLLQSVTNTGVWIYQSQGQISIMFRWQIVKSAMSIIGFIVGIWLGSIETVALCYLIVLLSLFFFDILIPGKLIGVSFSTVIVNLYPAAFCSLVMGIGVWICGGLFMAILPVWQRLLLEILVGIIVYFACVHGFKIKAYREFQDLKTYFVRRYISGNPAK